MINVKENKENLIVDITEAKYMTFIPHLDGYFKCVTLLIDKIDKDEDNTLIYPLLFSFSQYMELWIKFIVLSINDSSDLIKKLKSHQVKRILDDSIKKYEYLFTDYNIDKNLLIELSNQYDYFNNFIKHNKSLSESARFPFDNKGESIIINYKKIDELSDSGYDSLKHNIIRILEITSQINKNLFGSLINKVEIQNK